MKDRRPVDELTLEELEQIVRLRRRQARIERLRRLGKREQVALDPLSEPAPAIEPQRLPADYTHFSDSGASAQYRAQPVDEPQEALKRQRQPRPIQWGWLRDKSLLVLELGILAALVIVLVGSLATLKEINEASGQVQALPTLTLTPLIGVTPPVQVVLLPGGHTPPDSPGGPAPAEVPAHLQDLVRAITPLPVPTKGPEQAIRIQIPAIGVDAPVVEGDDWEALKQGAGHHIGSANPGENGNCIISAHNDIFGEIFRDLPDLDLGDEVLLHTATQVFRYRVVQQRIIPPEDVSVMYPTSIPVLTLISCYPYRIDSHRIVVVAELRP